MTDKRLMVTAGEIRKQLEHLPDDMPVEFLPISNAWMGTMEPLRFSAELNFYTPDKCSIAEPYSPDAVCSIYLYEDKEEVTG